MPGPPPEAMFDYLYAELPRALAGQRAAVVAAGVSFEGKKVVSDVADEVAEVAGWLSPRIGGVGPMTRAMLLSNAVAAAERHAG